VVGSEADEGILQVHAANVYDNLPDEEVVRRDGRLYFVQVRCYIPRAEAERLCVVFGVLVEKLRSTIHRILEGGFDELCKVCSRITCATTWNCFLSPIYN